MIYKYKNKSLLCRIIVYSIDLQIIAFCHFAGESLNEKVSLFLLISCSTSSITGIKEILAADLKAEMKTDPNLVILDVRHPEELTGEYKHVV